ncbi:DinB family protein [Paenibacillus psychroresistens]|uniref:DinB family protein n=1 Tax=Paenibacillus psychroresistens TaxID=1778678 RepID=A0A6B8RC92_9BACL|nr:DinB family protein [Paenibacillus psychroresistens]QGQ94131.1 DinB family protein [Paenibacillus psychroresistens]
MTEEQVFSHMGLVRSRTLKWIEAIDSTIFEVMPANFNNTIQWHVGHILLVQDRLTLRLMGEKISLPEEYTAWFGPGTKPADWQGQPPAVELLLQELREQTERLQIFISGKLADKLAVPFLHYETLEESIGYSFYHEGIHLGYMMGLRRAIEAKTA